MKDEYRRVAPIYDFLLDGFNEGLRGIGLRVYPPKAGMSVLDVCCGTGAQLQAYKARGCSVRGMDRSPAMLARSMRKLGGDSILEADARAVPFADASFDLVLCTLALHEMDPEDRPVVLSEMARVVDPAGKVLVIDFHAGPVRFPKGWISKTGIFVAELTAGRRHFRNYRRYIRMGGLPPLWGGAGLTPLKEKVVGGGTFAVTLLEKTRTKREGTRKI
jgi:ubiquinone/menaquinone biosynthesis C-methylase UbiE